MATIEVNHKTLRDVADAVASFCAVQDKEMHVADAEIKSMLLVDWIGADAQQFGVKWETIDENGTATVKFRESLRKFSENLFACANEYQKAQEDIYNLANRLPKYLYW